MKYYPAFLDLSGRPVLLVGGGEPAARKLRLLLKAGARVTAVAPHVTGAIVNGSLAWLVAAGAGRARGRFSDWIHRWLPGSVLVYLGLRLLWQEN